MPKKKKKEKKGGGKTDGGLPPPPKFDDARQTVLEAMLSYKISGKEDVINQYSDEAEVCKDRNYQQKDKNYQLKHEQQGHLQTLLQQCKHQDEEENGKRIVEKEEVERAQLEKIELAKHVVQDLEDIKERTVAIEGTLEEARMELERLQTYKTEVQYEQSDLITLMHQRISQMQEQEESLKDELSIQLEEAKADIERELSKMTERKKEEISLKILQAMGADTRAEISDNQWIKKQISLLTEELARLQQEVDAMEQRNLQLMDTVNNYHRREVEATQKVFAAGGGGACVDQLLQRTISAWSHASSRSESTTHLPALIDKPRRKVDGTHTSKDLDMGLMSVEGSRVPMKPLPDSFHLPPLQEQLNPASQQSTSSRWPITTTMLKSIQS